MREYLLVLLTAASTTYLLCGMCRRVAIKVGAVAPVRARDVHAVPVPYLGGLAMLGGVAAAFLLAAQLPFLSRHAVVAHDARAILVAASVICVVGVLDDVFDLPALAKAAGQVLAAGIVVVNGVRMFWIAMPQRIIVLDNATSILITVIFIFVCVNAINFVDGLDGLAGGVVAIGGLAFFSYTYLLAHEQDLVLATTASLVTVTIAGVCLGFLPHNFFPARMFMGDSGSMLLGLLLAASTISLTGQIDASGLSARGAGLVTAYLPIVLPFAVLALPLLDLVLAYARRTMNGTWWFVADKQHLHHRLLQLGHSQTRAALLMYLWTAIISFGAIAVGLAPGWWAVLGLVVTLLVATALTWPRPRRA
ncbi:MAG TPA: undecaprenyl/decaprenyl-phosphate alpha-N-acetylglucosaminyl 1-phosphate transferase [Candidatus Luteococcus avicola]|nr:undecaprenyl/decaprenyl-phosphate alpha-N-acetylglucosaminyl 1-phosphate transferase [Candidatus Luteococcus avicola]